MKNCRVAGGILIIALLIGLPMAFVAAQQPQGQGRRGAPPATTEPQGPVRKFPYPAIRNQSGVLPTGPKVQPYNSPPLGDGPWAMETYEQRNIKVSIVTKGLTAPWGIAFVPPAPGSTDNVILVTEKAGRLRVIRNGA